MGTLGAGAVCGLLCRGACLALIGMATGVIGDEGATPCEDVPVRVEHELRESPGSWEVLYEQYRRFARCDDGYLASMWSDQVAGLLLRRWGSLPELGGIIERDQGFRRFVLRHLSESAGVAELRLIRRSARERCPAGQVSLCRAIELQAARSIKRSVELLPR